jgi:archaea-specific DNA-binding protein
MNFLFSEPNESKPFFWGARCGMTKDEKKKIDPDSNIIYVGNKPPMNYVTAIMALLNSGNFTEVVLKARGNAISRAVDAAEITHNRFLTNAEVTRIDIGTETVTNEEGRKSNVSSIEICLAMKKIEK